jgi:predicted O-methyltransferase YrrM
MLRRLANVWTLRGLPMPVARFWFRARRVAARTGDEFSPISVTRPAELRRILRLAGHGGHVVELGTGTGWTAIALALAGGEEGPRPGAPPAGLVFVDSSHERAETLASFRAWEPALAPGGAIAFHDYCEPGYPGVSEAIGELGLDGEVHGSLFVWRKR